MAKFRDVRESDIRHIATLRAVAAALGIAVVFLLALLTISTRSVRLSLPPTLEYGAEIATGKIQPHEVYSFAGYIHQQLYTWRNDGQIDFKKNIERLRYFLSPDSFQHYRKKFKTLDKKGELSKRSRYVLPAAAYADNLVTVHSKRSWTVTLYYYLHETLDGITIKDGIKIAVSLPVFYENKDPQYNPWGLWIGVPLASPQRI